MESDKLCYYSASKDVFPGQGSNEYVNNGSNYEDLSKNKNWRKVLSNFHEYPFIFNEKKMEYN